MRMISVVLSINLFVGVVPASTEEQAVICKGSHWAYKFIFNGTSCLQEQKATREIPGTYAKGHVNKFPPMSASDCWESAAKIQMDSASCCLNDMNAKTSCSTKRIKY